MHRSSDLVLCIVDVQQAADPVDAGRADAGVPPPEAPPRGGGGGAAGRRARAAQVPRHHLAGGPGRAPHPGHPTHQTMIVFMFVFLRLLCITAIKSSLISV